MLALERQVLQEERPPRSRPAPSATAHRLLYRVGQVINHIRQHYRGVIYGWDTVCCATPMYCFSPPFLLWARFPCLIGSFIVSLLSEIGGYRR